MLSGIESPVRSPGSREEQDLLERSTKKTKRDERSPEGHRNTLMMDVVQETPLASRGCIYQPRENEPEEEIASEEEEMDESNSDPDCPTIVVTKAEKDCNVSSYIVNFSDIKDMKELREKQNEESGGDTKKKPRLSWNPEMHMRFVLAVNKFGYDSKASSYPFLQKT
nr:two-component response regulator ARR2-like [Ipomoea batatas]